MIRRLAIIAGAGALLLSLNFTLQAQEEFKPQLQKITVNGTPLYDASSKDKKTLELDSSAPAKFEYSFVNKGTKPSDKPATVFVHFDSDGEIALGGDYKPETPSTSWEKDKTAVDTKSVDLTNIKGKSVDVFLGLYLQDDGGDRLPLVNDGFGDDQRLPVGSIKVK